jgi:hypothetical protein
VIVALAPGLADPCLASLDVTQVSSLTLSGKILSNPTTEQWMFAIFQTCFLVQSWNSEQDVYAGINCPLRRTTSRRKKSNIVLIITSRGQFLTSPLGVNFDPRGEFVPQGWICPPGVNFVPWGWSYPLGVKFYVRPSILLSSREWWMGWIFSLWDKFHP